MPAFPIRRILGCFLCLTAASGLFAADPVAQDAGKPQPAHGHSYHGESFNEGPRQRAYLMGTTGPVNFPVTTTHPDAQKFINQGIGQLHGFWYFEAERSFRQAAQLDPQCAIAYWGMALANTNNGKRAKGFIAEAVKRKGPVTEREKMYIDALEEFHSDAKKDKDKERHEGYAKALERIIYKFPQDIEAKAFLGLQLWLNRDHGIPISSHLSIDALLKEVHAVEPMHPCHHYRIHLWNYVQPTLALPSSALCGQSAPGIAHMWHMSGHIYSEMQRYQDSVWQQEASARVDHAYMMRDRIFPDQIHNYAHNNEWLVRDLSHLGQIRKGLSVAKNLVELPRHPQYNTLTGGKSAYFGRMRLFDELVRYELWDELIALCNSPYLEPTEDNGEQIKRLRLLGTASFRKGDVTTGLQRLADLEERLKTERWKLNIEELVPATTVTQAPAPSPTGEPRPDPIVGPTAEEDGRLKPFELAVEELKGHAAVAQGDYKAGLPHFRKAGGISAGYLAKVEYLAGDREAALKSARELINSHKQQVQPLAQLVEILWMAGEKKEAGERFEDLRKMASHADLDVPLLSRLAPVAAAANLPADWRLPAVASTDVGVRPSLESLGPLHWQPGPVPEWSAGDGKGGRVSQAEYRGRPVIVIFYLGYQCLHCAEQLQAFAPMVKEFEDAGVSLIAISSDDDAGLAKSIENYKAGGSFPFPLASDSGLEAFKAFRAFDDFEGKPLHGTFLIDANGLVRWQDIGYEPFRDAKFLLKESRRLLSLSGGKTPIAKTPAAAVQASD
ncbi:MAG: redoxin domain-containing protein [Planctomycetes bacterium]|nr:redoxin domain-containing protein [Planctomycetota bacterium]